MATWTFGVKTAANTSLAADFTIIAATSALNFGSGDRDTVMQAISVGSWASAMHVVDGNTSSENDKCPDPHAWSVVMGVDTGTYYGYNGVSGNDLVGPMNIHSAPSGATFTDDPFMASYNTSSPAPYEGINFHFDHGAVAVAMTPVQLWFGSEDPVTSQHAACRVEALELATVGPLDAGWVHITPADKLTLSDHNGTSTGHSWWVALTLKPTAISFNAEGRIKIEGTYF